MSKTTAALALVALVMGLVFGLSVDELTAFGDAPIEVAEPESPTSTDTSAPPESPATTSLSDAPERNWTMIALIGVGIGVLLGVGLGRHRNK